MRTVQVGSKTFRSAPSVALMMPPPMRATSIWSALLAGLLARLDTCRSYACERVH
ncbi:Uncharacterised protein [Mycobacteroides abscessus]|nr:Uncharacterised protein [Mycobacteroides abscessus]